MITADQPQHDHDFDWIGFSNRAPATRATFISASGDGGGSNDNDVNHLEPDGNAQSTETLLGKILRIHIEGDGSYTIPIDNPFFGAAPPVKQEIWTFGFRNPFRASFERGYRYILFWRCRGVLSREEVDVQLALKPGWWRKLRMAFARGLHSEPVLPEDDPPATECR